ncbi:MAG: response regulator [Archangiaceae bacterium]|nr:response regulator [Archangiaceae bacterium]
MKRKLLLVDDDAMQLKLTAAILADAGFEVRTATGGAEALERARAERPDLVLSDVLMRDCDGFRLCQQVRAEPSLAGVPVVLVSAHFSSERDKSLAAAVGASAFAERSPDFSRELAAVSEALARATPAGEPAGDAGALYAERVSEQLTQLLDKARSADMRYRTLFESANDGIVVLDESGVIVETNRRFVEMTGHPRERLVGQHFASFGTPEEAAQNLVHFQRGLSGAHAALTRVVRPDGREVQVEFSISTLEVDGRRQMLGIGRDVSNLMQVTRELAASEGRYRDLVENMLDTAWVSELATGKVLFMAPNVVELTGFTAAQLSEAGGALYGSRIHPEDRAGVNHGLQELRAHRPMDVEYRWHHQDGSWRWLRSRARTAVREGVELVEGLISDSTQRKKLELEFRQAQKMEAIGLLTGGVAHDFNNLLCVILAHADMLARTLEDSDARREDVSSIREAGERAAGLTRQLLAFSRKQVLQPRLLELGTVLSGVEKLLRRVIGEDVRLDLATEPELNVLADAGQLEQVLMNLAVNARDAMPDGGALTVRAGRAKLRAGEVGTVPAGDWVRLSVQDDGTGMDEATRLRIFEPFFTTKAAGKGTGLGLSTCYGIVKQSGGHIVVDSAPGAGSTFTLYLPAASTAAVAAPAPPRAVQGGHETLLVVEDDKSLRNTLARGLARLGYPVLTAGSVDEAQALYRQHREVKLVLSDLVLPDDDGLDLIDALRAEAFTGAVLIMSGYIDRTELQDALTASRLPFMQKPFSRETLARRVRELLDAK